jgi:hypothetical protein
MAISLEALVTRLQNAVPAEDGVPGDEQYEQAVEDAVADYSNRNPLRRLATLSIRSGVATYDLPADFLKIITLQSLTSQDGVIVTGAGLIPVSNTYRERYYVTGRRQITFSPTPQYTVDRNLWYAAAHALDDGDEYPDMTDGDAAIVMLKARSLALDLQANSAAGEGWMYQVGDEKVDKRGKVENTRQAARDLEAQYLEAVQAAIGAVGMRADYDLLGR